MSSTDQARVGVLVPQGNTVHAAELGRLKPPGVEFSVLGFTYPQNSTDFCGDVAQRMIPAMTEFRAWSADIVLVGCTTVSMACGGEAFTSTLESAAGVAVVTAAQAGREAMAALELKAVAVATPYGAINNAVIRKFLEDAEVRIASLEGLDLDRTIETWVAGQPTLTPDRVFAHSMASDRPDADGLYLPCTGMVSIDAIDRFETATGKPAFSSVQAGYWASLRRLGFDGRRAGAGRLLAQWDF